LGKIFGTALAVLAIFSICGGLPGVANVEPVSGSPGNIHVPGGCPTIQAAAGNDTGIPYTPEAKRILLIEKDKSNLTEGQKKLSTDLLQLVDSSFLPPGQTTENLELQMESLEQLRPAGSVSGKADGEVAGDLVYVYVYLKPPAETRDIEPYVWEITDRDEGNHLAVAWVEVKHLETLASQEAVRTIRTVMPPLVMTGSVTTEGDVIHNTSNVRSTYSQNGSGMKVGVISDGVDGCPGFRRSACLLNRTEQHGRW
jgi:hypothetical protein